MRINEIRSKEVDVTLSAGELVMLGNIMYFYEKNLKAIEPDSREPNEQFHDLNAAVIIARDLSQYGNLDSFSLKKIVQHKVAAHPDGRLAEFLEGIANGCGREVDIDSLKGAQERMDKFLDSLGAESRGE